MTVVSSCTQRLHESHHLFSLSASIALPLLFGNVAFAVSSGAHEQSASFPAWTYREPNGRMEWNELPDCKVRCIGPDRIDWQGYHLLLFGDDGGGWDDSNAIETDVICTSDGTASSTASAVDKKDSSPLDDLDAACGGAITALKEELDNRTNAAGRRTAAAQLIFGGQREALRVAWIRMTGSSGTLGANSSLSVSARKVGTALADMIQSSELKWIESMALVLPRNCTVTSSTEYLTEMMTAFWIGLYKDSRYKSGTGGASNGAPAFSLKKLDLVWSSSGINLSDAEWKRPLFKARALAAAVYLAKDIVQAPHNVLNSVSLAETAQRLAKTHRHLSCQILDQEDCQRRGMGSFLGVARGSETPGRFIHLTYKSPRTNGKPKKSLALIGKGLLFDTGGYSIKGASMMELMKFDCGGAAAVLGAALALALLEPSDVEVHVCVAACENMINERAVVPGDVLRASNGKTIEVLNTDAEGRLTLADALVFCDRELRCDEIVEVSTLTGAAMVALGPSVAGMYSKNDGLASSLSAVSDSTGEKVWRMPLEEEYNEQLKSKIADLKNIGGRYGGSITAALFLQNFVEGGKPFAHIDMAGPVWNTKAGQATGWGVKLLTEWVCRRSVSASEE